MSNKRSIAVFVSAVVVIVLAGFFLGRSQSNVKLIDVHRTLERAQSDTSVVLLDVRTQAEFDSGYIEGAKLIPVQELDRRIDELAEFKDKEIIAYCRSGNRSGKAAVLLQKHGYTVYNMEGGILKWRAENLPLIEKPSE